jgi:putative flippase GtrA
MNNLMEWRPLQAPMSRELVRYIVVGGVAFACDASTLYVLTAFLGVYYLISAVVGFGIGLAVNYLLSRSWVFERRTLTNASVEATVFGVIGIAGLGLNEAILWTFQDKLGISYLIAKGVSGVAVFVWNFTIRKITLFR